jgi:hypothetical protein
VALYAQVKEHLVASGVLYEYVRVLFIQWNLVHKCEDDLKPIWNIAYDTYGKQISLSFTFFVLLHTLRAENYGF